MFRLGLINPRTPSACAYEPFSRPEPSKAETEVIASSRWRTRTSGLQTRLGFPTKLPPASLMRSSSSKTSPRSFSKTTAYWTGLPRFFVGSQSCDVCRRSLRPCSLREHKEPGLQDFALAVEQITTRTPVSLCAASCAL